MKLTAAKQSKAKRVLMDEVILDPEDEHLRVLYAVWPNGYVARTVDRKAVYLHRVIMCAELGQVVDHINGNPLDNRKSNLRICTQSDNLCNTSMRRDNKSGVKGVSFAKHVKKWCAQIKYKGEKFHLGYFDNIDDAAAAYQKAALKLHKEFSRICTEVKNEVDAG